MKSKLTKRIAGCIKVKVLHTLNYLSHKLEIVTLVILLCTPVLMAVGCNIPKPWKSTKNIKKDINQVTIKEYFKKDLNCYPGCVGYYVNDCGLIKWVSCKGFEYEKIK